MTPPDKPSKVRSGARNLVLGPGSALHELAHAAVGQRYADVDVEWGLVRSKTTLDWHDEVPVWGVVLTFLAPLLLAGVVVLAAAPIAGLLVSLPLPVQVYLGVQFALLAGPSGADVVHMTRVIANG